MKTNRSNGPDAPAGCSPARTRAAFKRWVSEVGGSRAAAALLHCSRSYVDMIRSGDRRPGLNTAHRIERLTDGKIRMPDWLSPTEPGKRHPTTEA